MELAATITTDDAGVTAVQLHTPTRPEDTTLALDWGRMVGRGLSAQPTLDSVPTNDLNDFTTRAALSALGRGYSLGTHVVRQLEQSEQGRRVLAVLEAQPNLFSHLETPTVHIAIVVSNISDPSDAERGIYYSLWRHGHGSDFVPVERIGSVCQRYTIVFAPTGSLVTLSAQCAQQLAQYVRKGGILFTEAGSLPTSAEPQATFRDLLGGGTLEPHEAGHENLRLHPARGTLEEGNIFWAVLDVGAQSVPVDPPYEFPTDTGAVVHWLGFFEDCRQPAVLRVRQGKGSIYYIGGVLSTPTLRPEGEDNTRVYPAVADVYGVPRLYNLAGPEGNNTFVRYLKDQVNVCVSRPTKDGWLVPVINNGDKPVRCSVFIAGAAPAAKTTDLLANAQRHSIRYGADRSVPLELPPFGSLLIHLN